MWKNAEIFIVLFCILELATAQMSLTTNVTEGECIVPDQPRNINPLWVAGRRTYFIPVASEYSYRHFAEALLGRAANDTAELARMCLKVFVSGLRSRTYGFNRIIDQSCSLTRRYFQTFVPGQLRCRVDNASPGTRTSTLFNDYIDNIVMTDNWTYNLMVRCVNGVRDYRVMSIAPELPDSTFAQIRARISSLGFNPDLIRRLVCNGVTQDNQLL